jgi:hypothetical protein
MRTDSLHGLTLRNLIAAAYTLGRALEHCTARSTEIRQARVAGTAPTWGGGWTLSAEEIRVLSRCGGQIRSGRALDPRTAWRFLGIIARVAPERAAEVELALSDWQRALRPARPKTDPLGVKVTDALGIGELKRMQWRTGRQRPAAKGRSRLVGKIAKYCDS